MREPKLAEGGWHECQCCGMIWHGDSLLDIEDFFQRVEAGESVPSGECPDDLPRDASPRSELNERL